MQLLQAGNVHLHVLAAPGSWERIGPRIFGKELRSNIMTKHYAQMSQHYSTEQTAEVMLGCYAPCVAFG